MILEFMGDERIPYIVFISMLIGLDLFLLRRIVKKENKK
jgi:hypothetical protein